MENKKSNKKVLSIIVIAIVVVLLIYVLIFRSNGTSNVVNNSSSNQPVVSSENNNSTVLSDSKSTTYSISEIAKHNTSTDCWIAINGSVVDVTKFIASGKHNPKIISACGLDATEAFSKVSKHASPEVQALFNQFIIGKLKS